MTTLRYLCRLRVLFPIRQSLSDICLFLILYLIWFLVYFAQHTIAMWRNHPCPCLHPRKHCRFPGLPSGYCLLRLYLLMRDWYTVWLVLWAVSCLRACFPWHRICASVWCVIPDVWLLCHRRNHQVCRKQSHRCRYFLFYLRWYLSRLRRMGFRSHWLFANSRVRFCCRHSPVAGFQVPW